MPKTWYSILNKLSASQYKKLKYIVIAIIVLFLVGNKGFRSLVSNFRELKNLEKEKIALQLENKELRLKLKLIKNNDYMETQARKKLGYLRQGEIEYRFPPPENSEAARQ